MRCQVHRAHTHVRLCDAVLVDRLQHLHHLLRLGETFSDWNDPTKTKHLHDALADSIVANLKVADASTLDKARALRDRLKTQVRDVEGDRRYMPPPPSYMPPPSAPPLDARPTTPVVPVPIPAGAVATPTPAPATSPWQRPTDPRPPAPPTVRPCPECGSPELVAVDNVYLGSVPVMIVICTQCRATRTFCVQMPATARSIVADPRSPNPYR